MLKRRFESAMLLLLLLLLSVSGMSVRLVRLSSRASYTRGQVLVRERGSSAALALVVSTRAKRVGTN
jgi:hypothetical protein